MHQGQVPAIPAGLFELRSTLETEWPARTAALLASGTPVAIDLETMTDDELRAHAASVGAAVADDADRATVIAAIKAKTPAAPPWGSDENFNAERAWKLIQDLRSDVAKLKGERDDLRVTVKKHEDSTKTDHEKAAERAAEAERTASAAVLEAARLRVAIKKNLTEAQAKRLVGETEEQLEADADELLATFTSDDDGGDQLRRTPRERLRPGAAPSSEPEETDPAKLAAMVPRPY